MAHEQAYGSAASAKCGPVRASAGKRFISSDKIETAGATGILYGMLTENQSNGIRHYMASSKFVELGRGFFVANIVYYIEKLVP